MTSSIRVLIVLLGACTIGFGQCKKIEAEVSVTDTKDGLKNGKIVLDLKTLKKGDLLISLFGPHKQNKLEIDNTEIKDLEKGKYLVVIVGKKEDDNYCPKSIEATIN